MPIETIKKVNNFQISIYGYDEDSYIKNTGRQLFDNVVKSLNLLQHHNIKFDVSFIANKDYLMNYDKYNEFISKIKYKKIILGFADYEGRMRYNSEWGLDENEKVQVEKLFSVFNDEGEKEEEEVKWCNAGTFSYSINENGIFYLCQSLTCDAHKIGTFADFNKRILNNDFDIYDHMKINKAYISNMCKFKEILK